MQFPEKTYSRNASVLCERQVPEGKSCESIVERDMGTAR